MVKFKTVKEVKDFLLRDNGQNSLYWVTSLQARRYKIILGQRNEPLIFDTKFDSKHTLLPEYLPKIYIL